MDMKYVRWCAIVLFTGVLVFSLAKLGSYYGELHRGQKVVDGLAEIAVKPRPTQPQTPPTQPTRGPDTDTTEPDSPEKPTEEPTEPVEYAPIEVDFGALQASCGDIVGWLYCPDTVVNYPVVQSGDNAYYLHRLPNGDYNSAGTLFLDYRCPGDFSGEGSIVYGHHMKNGSMFALLPEYRSQSYYEKHPVWYLLTPEQDYKLVLVAGFVTGDDSWVYSLPLTGEERQKLVERSDFSANVPILDTDRVVLLSTCSYEFENARYVVAGVLQSLGRP